MVNQEKELTKAVLAAGHEVVSVYKDKGSGLNVKRSGLTKLLKVAKSGEFDMVYVTHVDRLARFGVPWLE